MSQLTPVTEQDIRAFCESCSWTFQAWSIHRVFQDSLPPGDSRLARKHGYFLNRLGIISQEYTLLQIAKLDDPAIQSGKLNLTVDRIVEHGNWDRATRAQLEELRVELRILPSHLSVLRNKILAHHDRDVALAGTAVGGFPAGMDESYFEALHAFASLAHKATFGFIYAFDDFARRDTELFVADLVAMSSDGQVGNA